MGKPSQALLRASVPIRSQHCTRGVAASRGGNEALVLELVKRGAEVNARDEKKERRALLKHAYDEGPSVFFSSPRHYTI